MSNSKVLGVSENPMNDFANSELHRLLLKFLDWQNLLQHFVVSLDSAANYKDLNQSLNRIKMDIRAEAQLAKQKLRHPTSAKQKHIYEKIEDISQLLNARVDSKPYKKLRDNVATVEFELSLAIEKLKASLGNGILG